MRQLELTSVDGVRLEAVRHSVVGGVHRGAVLLVHGFGADMAVGGMFVPLAERLADASFTVLRFSFRGHGGSGGTPRGVTIAGELLDLQAAVEHLLGSSGGPLAIVASSFGAVSTTLSLPWLGERLDRFALWAPVLDLRRTFLDPELPWGEENFGPDQRKLLETQGFLTLDGGFEAGRVLFDEFRHYDPLKCFTASSPPALVVHGDEDASVSYDIARRAAGGRPNTRFHTARGADHGFGAPHRRAEVVAITAQWLAGGPGTP